MQASMPLWLDWVASCSSPPPFICLFVFTLIYCIYVRVCVWARAFQGVRVNVRGQVGGMLSFHPIGPADQTSCIRLIASIFASRAISQQTLYRL